MKVFSWIFLAFVIAATVWSALNEDVLATIITAVLGAMIFVVMRVCVWAADGRFTRQSGGTIKPAPDLKGTDTRAVIREHVEECPICQRYEEQRKKAKETDG